jgi:L-amino acid N-acyltransferase YncA
MRGSSGSSRSEAKPNVAPREKPVIEAMSPEDWPEVRRIYEAGIATRNATFETQAPGWAAWDEVHLADHRVVARLDEEVVGWAALAPVSHRPVYAGVAEVSVYVADGARGRGVGRALLSAVVESSERVGIWTLQTGIFPENEASLALHRGLGFRQVGVRERIGQHRGVWRDVIFLERRSVRAGT